MTARPDFRYFDRLRVRWVEVDLQKIVFNGHYLMYFDTAVAGYWRALALPYHETMDSLAGDLFVRKATLEYHASARYDDQLEVGIRTARIGNSSMVFECGVFKGARLLVSGELVYVFADPTTQTSRPVPPILREVLLGFEAGQAMVKVSVGTWDQLGPAARPIRQQVFIDEQHIPVAMEWDAADALALHAVAYNRLGLPLATGRLLEHAPGVTDGVANGGANGVAMIGRMAVLASVRGSQIGRAVLLALMQAARERGFQSVLLHAQASALPFYLRMGFTARGDAFDEAGITHIEMVRTL